MSTIVDQPLFITKDVLLKGIEKTAMYKLSRDPSKWDQEIMTFLHEQNPYLQDYDIRIHMNKVDPEAGVGVGQIVVNEKVAIPVIIENSKLYPLDLFWHDDKLHPTTKPSLMGALQSTSIGKAVEPGQGEISDVSLYNATRPPFSGKYSFASGLTFSKEELEEAMSTMDPEALDFALRNNTTFKESLADYAVEAKKPEEMKKESEAKSTIVVEGFKPGSYVDVENPGVYAVVMDGFRKTAAMVFDMVLGWDDKIVEGQKMALGVENREIALQESFGGIPVESAELLKIAMSELRPKAGDIGIYWLVKNGHAIATLPVRVKYGGSGDDLMPFIKVAVVGLEDDELVVYQSEDYVGLSKIGENIFMSNEWQFSKIGSGCTIASVDTANKFEWPNETIEIRKEGEIFYLEGMEIEGLSGTGDGRKDFYDALANRLDHDTAGLIMREAEKTGQAFFTFQEEGQTKTAEMEKKAELIKLARRYGLGPIRLVHLAAHIKPCERVEFFKVAAEVGEEEAKSTVDAILGLNFVNDENLYKFVEKTEVLENSLDTLSKLLLASRLGLDIEQAPLRTAMFAMDEVVRQLRNLGSQVYGEET